MVEPTAHIRSFEPSDDKEVRFIVGKSNMESLAVANQRVYTHPLTLSIWVALSCMFIEYMHWWPDVPEHGNWAYLRPLPAFAAMAVPILALVDWLNRPYFEKRTQDALRRRDMIDIRSYYSHSPSSGLWILEFNEQFVGLLALDATLEFISDQVPSKNKKDEKQKSSSIAVIRHFYVDEPYRGSGVQDDLLAHAVRHAFDADSSLERIKADDSPLMRYTQQSLRSAGFYLEEHTETVGVFGWKLGTRVLERAEWMNVH